MQAARNRFNNSPWRWFLLALLIASMVAVFTRERAPEPPKPPASSYAQIEERIEAGKVKEVEYDPNRLTVRVTETDKKKVPPYDVAVPAVNGDEGLQSVLKTARENKVQVKSQPLSSGEGGLSAALIRMLPTLLILGIAIYLLRSYMPGGRSKIEPAKSDVTFAEVAGCGEAIEELQDVRSFLADSKKYERLGAKVPKGVLLYGPPGTGKTLLAKAVANEAGIPFYEASGAEFVEMYAGLGAKRVRQLFEEAKKTAPSIIFIDELDSIGGKRSSGGGDGATREGDQTLNQLLTEIDGFSVSQHPVILMGATNMLENLDSALLRPGRFDRHIAIDPPDKHGRLDILKVHATDKRLADDVDLLEMATHSSGMSGAELAHWLNEAALMAARHNHDSITRADIDDAFFRIVAGAKKQHRAMSDDERKTVAYHEAGHAILGERLKTTERVHKISIIPRGRSGGQTISVSEEDVFLYSEGKLRDTIAMLMGGRAAEELVFGRLTSGAANDLQRATTLAVRMVTELGMGAALGLRVNVEQGVALGPDLQAAVDQEVKQLLADEYERARSLLSGKRATMDRIADALLREETIDRSRFVELLDAET